MSEWRQKLRGTTLQLDGQTGLDGLLTYDYERKEMRVFDAVLLGGYRIPNKTTNDSLYVKGADGVLVADANLAIADGFYRHTSGASNIPLAVAGAIMVNCSTDTATGDVTQYWSHNVLNIAYIRARKTGVWTSWDRVVTKSYGDTLYLGIAATAANATLLNGQPDTFYTNITARLGYTPVNKAGDTFGGNMNAGGFNITNAALMSSTQLAATTPAAVTLASTNHGFQIGTSGATNLAMDSNTIQARNNGANALLRIQNLGGSLSIANADGIVMPQKASPVPTAEGETWWKPSEDAFYVGNGASTTIFRANLWEVVAGGNIDVTSVAQVDLNGLTNYRFIRITYEAQPATDGADILLRVSTDNGSTFLAGATEYNNFWFRNDGTTLTGVASSTTGIVLDAGIGVDSGSLASLVGTINLYQFNVNALKWKSEAFVRNAAAAGRQIMCSGDGTSTAVKTSIRFIASAGNLSALRAVVEGMR